MLETIWRCAIEWIAFVLDNNIKNHLNECKQIVLYNNRGISV